MEKVGLSRPSAETTLLEIVTSTIEEAVLIFDRSGSLIWWSPQARQILGLSERVSIGTLWDRILPVLPFPLHTDFLSTGDEAASVDFQPDGHQCLLLPPTHFWYPRPDGSRRYLELTARYWKLHSTESLVIVTIRDKTPQVLPFTHQQHVCRLFGLVGISEAMQQTFRKIWETAISGRPLWVEGPSGVGKKEVARTLHALLELPSEACLFVPCTTKIGNSQEEKPILPQVIAFVSSVKSSGRPRSHIATIVLHEIGYLSQPTQNWLAQFLEESRLSLHHSGFTGNSPQFQIVALSTQFLQELWTGGILNPQLYLLFRENVLCIPPLAERPEDIPLLAQHFMNVYRTQNKVGPRRISPAALAKLLNASWPGNVAQLKTAISCGCAVAEGDILLPSHLPPELVWGGTEGTSTGNPGISPLAGTVPGLSDESDSRGKASAFQQTSPEVRESSTTASQLLRLKSLLVANNWNVAKTARQLGVSRTTLYKWIERWRLERPRSP
jgi:DNA-binding NtrC family response regulator